MRNRMKNLLSEAGGGSAAGFAKDSGGPKKYILVVDDDEHLLQTLVDFLAFKGFETAGARSGEEALIKLSERKPDLVILDISMPGMGGVGFLRRITDAEGRRQCPVLVLTARGCVSGK
jgi:DNA-binding response OmpR family regulator